MVNWILIAESALVIFPFLMEFVILDLLSRLYFIFFVLLIWFLLTLILFLFVLLICVKVFFLKFKFLFILQRLQNEFNIYILAVAFLAIARFNIFNIHFILLLTIFTIPIIITYFFFSLLSLRAPLNFFTILILWIFGITFI